MKRVIALLSAAFMLLSLTACGSDKSKDKSDAFTASNLTEAPASGTMLRQYREAYYPFPGGYTVSGISSRLSLTVEDKSNLVLSSNGSAAKVNWSDGTYEEIDLDGRELTSASLCSDGIVLSVLKKVVDSTSPYYLVDKSSPGISELKLSNPYDPTEGAGRPVRGWQANT